MKNTEEIRATVAQLYGEDVIDNMSMFEGPAFINAIVGVDLHHHKIIYSYDKMVECLMEEDGMTMDEAIDFIDYNTLRTIPYMPNPPIIMMDILEL